MLHVSQRLTCAHAPRPAELARRAGEAGAPGGAGASALDGFKAKLLAARAENAALRKGACMHPMRPTRTCLARIYVAPRSCHALAIIAADACLLPRLAAQRMSSCGRSRRASDTRCVKPARSDREIG